MFDMYIYGLSVEILRTAFGLYGLSNSNLIN